MSPSLDRLRVALKFSLWVWALYWPGGGLLLLHGGLDPVSIAVTFLSLGGFVAILASGALRADSSHRWREWFLERPLYLVLSLGALVVAAVALPGVESFALLLFAALWFGGLGLCAARLRAHLRAEGLGVRASRADQLVVLLALVGVASFLVLFDAAVPLAGGPPFPLPSALVALASWVNLLYPPFLLLAAKPFRAPLSWPSRRRAVAERRRKAPADAARGVQP